MEMSEIQAARLLLGGDGRAGQAASRQVGQESASVRYGEVKSVDAEAGTVTVLLDGQAREITLTDATASTRLKAGDRVKIVKQGQSWVIDLAGGISRALDTAVSEANARMDAYDTAVETLADSFSLLAQKVPVKYRAAGSGDGWSNSSNYTTWYTFKPTAVDGTAPMLFWCSIVLTSPACTRAYSYGYASYYEWMVQWPSTANVNSADKLPEVFVGASCEGNTADAYSWNRTTDGLGPLILLTHFSGNLPATRMEVFCASRI